MKILFYYPDSERSIALSSVMIAFQKQGHQVFLLTHEQAGDLHHDVEVEGVKALVYKIQKKNSLIFYIRHILYLAHFVRKNKIEIVYSHIQLANFISCFAQYFTSARFLLCRHHSDCGYVDDNFNERTMDRIINFFGRTFIVPSLKVYHQMTEIEHVRKERIHLIRYAYDFSLYPGPDINHAKEIREKFKCRLFLIKVARLIPEKRHLILFEAVKKLVQKKFDVKLLVLSEGPELENLELYITKNNLEENIFLMGFKRNVIDFVDASDIVVHVSESEASNNFIKEVSLIEKPVIVCKDVGDFDEYIINNQNGIVLTEKNPENELTIILEEIYDHKRDLQSLGKNLKTDVLRLFSINHIIHEYNQFNS